MSSIDEVRAGLMAANGRATDIAGALTQALTVAEEVRNDIQRITSGSSRGDVQDALGAYARLLDRLIEDRDMVLSASNTVEDIAAGL